MTETETGERPDTDSDPESESDQQGSSVLTVAIALAANALLAVAKTGAAIITGSSSMVAEAAHSWSDTGNEIFLLLAERRGARPRDAAHPRGYGRATFIWSLVAAFGLFSVGALVSIYHGTTELIHGAEGAGDPLINYVVIGVAVLLEGSSFLQAAFQVHGKAERFELHPWRFVTRTSNSTLRAVFFEDSSALLGLAIAAAGVGLHQLTGEAAWDAIGSILIGLLLAVVAVFLMQRNMSYLLGEGVNPDLEARIIDRLHAHPQVARVTYLHTEYVGPQRLFVVAAVDLTGDDAEPDLARRLRAVEEKFEEWEVIEDAVLTLSQPEDADLR